MGGYWLFPMIRVPLREVFGFYSRRMESWRTLFKVGGVFFFVWYFSKDEPQLGAWHCSFQSFRDKYCRKVKISIRTLENLHQVTRPFWAWLVLSPDGRSASNSCSTYGYDWRPHLESRPIFYKWTTVGFETWEIPAEFIRVDEVWEDA